MMAGTRPYLVKGPEPPKSGPARPDWITSALISYTQAAWAASLGRPVEVDEAVEMLRNVKRLTEVLLHVAGDERRKGA